MITRLTSQCRWPRTILTAVSRSSQPFPNFIHPPTAQLSQRALPSQFQRINRYSTPTTQAQTQGQKPSDLRSQFSPEPAPQPSPKATKRSLRRYIYATVFLTIGLMGGNYVRFVVAPRALPLPGSPEDELLVEVITSRAEKLPLVKSLSSDPTWTSFNAYSNFRPQDQPHTLTTGPLGGARGVGGYQRVFINEESGESISVVWFGGSLSGWPGVTHGGAIATILDESLARCAVRQLPGKTGVTAKLELNYLKPAIANTFYVIRVWPQKEESTEAKKWIIGRLETIDGKVCAEAKGLFVVPKTLKTRPIAGNF